MENFKSILSKCILAFSFIMLLFINSCKEKQITEIRMIGEALPPLEALDKVKKGFENETGIKVIVEQYAVNEVNQKVMTDLVSGSGSYDLILQPHKSLGKLVENGYILPIDDYLVDEQLHNKNFNPQDQLFKEQWNEISCYNGKKYGFPFTSLTMYLWYREDLLDDSTESENFKKKYGYELKVPEYFSEYRDIAEFFTRPEKQFYGTAIQGKRHDALWYEFINFLYAFGGNIMNTNHGSEYGPITINCPEAVEALDYYKSLIKYSPPGTLNYTWDDALAQMQQGNVFMVIMWNDATYAVDYSDDSKVAGKMGFSMIPKTKAHDQRIGQLEGWSYLIPKNSSHPKEAYRFIEWMMKEENQIKQHLNGGASARKSTYQNQSVKELSYTKTSLNMMDVTIAKPTIPEAIELYDILTLRLSQCLSGNLTSKQALDEVAIEIKKLLGNKVEYTCYPNSINE